ncbi:snfc-5, partial [Pristionchus pacificus]
LVGSLNMSTYGPRPNSFALEEGGERFYIGSEIGQYLKFHRGTLYKKYPALWKRSATIEEKAILQKLACTPAYLNTNIMLVRAQEVEDIFAGHDDKYKASGIASSTPRTDAGPSPMKTARTAPQTASWSGQQMSSGSHHLESVPCSTPLAHARGRLRPREGIYCAEDLNMAKKVMANADTPEDLIPIRLDMELDGIKLRDTFCYNRNETLITPEMVAEAICDDLDLPSVSFQSAIASAIYQQVEAAAEAVVPDPHTTDLRAVLKLNIHVGNVSLVDQFEWDMSDPNNNPEEFARSLCSELGLGGEFMAAIAYSIRGQLNYHQKTYAFSETPLPTVDCAFRNPTESDMWGPFLETLTDAEIEKKMRDQDRNTRRMRRLIYA